jgi:hypothetical protein
MIIYSRFSTNRKPQFRISTVISQGSKTKIVEKKALTQEAVDHVKGFISTHDYLNKFKLPFKIAAVEISDNSATFPFIQGDTMFSKVVNYVVNEDFENAIKLIDFYILEIVNKGLKTTKKKPTLELEKVLGKQIHKFKKFVEPGIVDLNLDNLIQSEDGNIYLIDYEWVWQSPVPVEYVIFKAITSLFNALIQMRLKIDVLLDKFGKYITNECVELEYNFQNYVINEGQPKSEFKKNYQNIRKYEPKSMYNHYELFEAQTKRLEFLENENNELKSHLGILQNELSSAKRILAKPAIKALLKASSATKRLKKLIK